MVVIERERGYHDTEDYAPFASTVKPRCFYHFKRYRAKKTDIREYCPQIYQPWKNHGPVGIIKTKKANDQKSRHQQDNGRIEHLKKDKGIDSPLAPKLQYRERIANHSSNKHYNNTIDDADQHAVKKRL
jgi:hypothetical protein